MVKAVRQGDCSFPKLFIFALKDNLKLEKELTWIADISLYDITLFGQDIEKLPDMLPKLKTRSAEVGLQMAFLLTVFQEESRWTKHKQRAYEKAKECIQESFVKGC